MVWSWADPLAGLVIAVVAVREGLEAWRGDDFSCVPNVSAASGVADTECGDGCCTHEEAR